MKICPACSREYRSERTHCERDGVMLVALTTGAGGRPEDLVGRIVDGRYQVEAIVGKGGMGTVYACRHVVVGKPFAMKVLRSGVEQTEGVLQRFIREAQTANSVRSRHIVEMTDFGQLPTGQFYVTMELLEGMDLGKALKRGLSRDQLLHVFIQCADVLELTHQRGIVHRDLKPDNIFLVHEEGDPLFVKLLDFGIAKAMHTGPSGLTETGVVLGTPYYMSPEQARGEEVDNRTDIYSLGVIMYRAFTGKLPFIADSAVGVLTRHLTEAPDPPSRVSGVDPAVERVILCCLEKRRNDRFQSMRGVADALRAIRGGGRPVSLVGAGPASLPAASGAYAAAPPSAPSGAHAAAQAPSGAFGPPSAGHGAPSGQHAALAASSGQHAAVASGQHAALAAPGGPYAAATGGSPALAASGPHAAAPHAAVAPAPAPANVYAPAPAPANVYAPAPASVHNAAAPVYAGAAAPQAQPPPSPAAEWTSHGLATSHAMRAQQPKKRWPLLVGALAMLGVGGVIAVTLGSLRRSGDAQPGAAMPDAVASTPATAAPSGEPSDAPSAAPAATESPTTAPAAPDAPSAAPTATDAPSAAPAASATATAAAPPATTAAGPKPSGKVPTGAAAGPRPTATGAKRPPEIRSPFD